MSGYPKTPPLSADCVAFDARGRVLLIKRGRPPFEGHWALPGGFIEIGETVEDGCRRELREETGLTADGALTLVGVYSAPGRDPRGATVSVTYTTTLSGGTPRGGDDAAHAEWVADWQSLPIAFDHKQMIADAVVVRTK